MFAIRATRCICVVTNAFCGSASQARGGFQKPLPHGSDYVMLGALLIRLVVEPRASEERVDLGAADDLDLGARPRARLAAVRVTRSARDRGWLIRECSTDAYARYSNRSRRVCCSRGSDWQACPLVTSCRSCRLLAVSGLAVGDCSGRAWPGACSRNSARARLAAGAGAAGSDEASAASPALRIGSPSGSDGGRVRGKRGERRPPRVARERSGSDNRRGRRFARKECLRAGEDENDTYRHQSTWE